MDKKLIIIVSVVIVVLIIAFYLTYTSGKKSGGNPSSAQFGAGVTGNLAADRIAFVQNLAISLHSDMDGFNTSWNTSLYDGAIALVDNELVALNNIYNELYQSESEQTFLQWLENENFDYGMQLDAFELDGKVKGLKAKLMTLGAS